jgi:polygalacturonase
MDLRTRREFGFGSLAALTAVNSLPQVFEVTTFGASGDGKKIETAAIQAAIDACAKAGGGSVLLPRGTYRSGTLRLRSHVTLQLARGARLFGSTELGDYPPISPAMRSYTDNYTDKSLIYAEDAEDLGIEGPGVIDGEGAAFHGPYKVRPYLMRFISCRDVSVREVTIQNSPMWVQHYLGCEAVRLTGLRVNSKVNANNDGIDIDSCRRVRISDCDISSGDDAIVLKSTSDRPCQDVAVSNCVLNSNCNAIKLGTESNGGFENISVSNCTVYDTRLAGIALETVDGGVLDGVVVSNIVMRNVTCPIFVRLGDRGRPFREGGARPAVGALRDVLIQGVIARGAGKIGCSITGLPGHRVENVTLRDVRMEFAGGGVRADAEREVLEQAEKYPEHSMFGTLPAYALYCRHVSRLHLHNVSTSFRSPEERPALVFDDVRDLESGSL